MTEYDANKPVDAQQWLEIDEFTRQGLVAEYHDSIGFTLEDEKGLDLHTWLHVAVENQLAMEEKYVQQTLAKLMRQGLSRHDAVHGIGAVLAEDIFKLQNDENYEFSPQRYRRRLEKLTAKRWRKGQV